MKKQILLFVLTLLPTLANAYDAEIKGIYYNLNSTTKKAEVTYHEVTYHDDYYTPYRGDIEIPSSVIYNGTEYTVTSIGVDAFAPHYDDDESYITSVTIPNSVTIIGDGAFWDCTNVEKLIYGEGCTNAVSTELTSVSEVTLPQTLKSIDANAFASFKNLTSITIPSSVTTIGEEAFQECSGLTSITIPSSVTTIGQNAFEGCTNVEKLIYAEGCTNAVSTGLTSVSEVTLPETLKSIDANAFADFKNLTSITIPNSVTTIGQNAFAGCSGLASITIPNSVKYIDGGAFSGTRWYENQPDGLVYAGKVAYHYKGTMQGNTEITLLEGTLSITSNAFSGCTGLTSITIPSSVTTIGGSAFKNCSGLTSIAIPSSVTTIVEEAFSGCTGLTSITIPSSVTSIESGAFQGCGGLTSVIIPYSVTLIGHHAFSGCTNLINVYCLAENVPAAASNSFPNNYITLYVPEASIDKYKTKSPWSGFKEIKALPDDMLEDPEIPGAERCATPSISFVDGQLTFACETEDVEFVPTVTCSPVYTLNGNKMKMGVTFNISVYARRDGYNKSDVATKTIEAKELGDVNGDGQLTISDITILVDKVMGRR